MAISIVLLGGCLAACSQDSSGDSAETGPQHCLVAPDGSDLNAELTLERLGYPGVDRWATSSFEEVYAAAYGGGGVTCDVQETDVTVIVGGGVETRFFDQVECAFIRVEPEGAALPVGDGVYVPVDAEAVGVSNLESLEPGDSVSLELRRLDPEGPGAMVVTGTGS